MPKALARACTHLGCGGGQPCAEHTKQRDQRRGTAFSRGYDARWQRESKLHLKKYPLCGMRPGGQLSVMSKCKDEGIVTPGDLVDHVRPHRGDKRLFWDKSNWQTLCHSCHNRKGAAGL